MQTNQEKNLYQILRGQMTSEKINESTYCTDQWLVVKFPAGAGGHFLDEGHTVVAEKICKRLIDLGYKNV